MIVKRIQRDIYTKMSEEYLINKNSHKNIKSKYIVIFIFSYLEEKRKLEIIKYNKNIQNILDIKLINYKFYLGKSLICELNRNVKVYNEYYDSISFEGEYLDGKRNGKGKEYNDFFGDLSFEGEYLKGKKNGKGYLEYNTGLTFEGDDIYDFKIKGKLAYIRDLDYEGEYFYYYK